MRCLKQGWSVLLLLFLCACTTSRQEPTPARTIPTSTEARETPTGIPPTKQPTAAETNPHIMSPIATSVPQVRPIYNAINIRNGPGADFAEIA